jgi:hypothetical protein
MLDNLRPGVTLRCKAEDCWLGRSESDVESQHFQGCTPHLYRLRIDGLALVSKY